MKIELNNKMVALATGGIVVLIIAIIGGFAFLYMRLSDQRKTNEVLQQQIKNGSSTVSAVTADTNTPTTPPVIATAIPGQAGLQGLQGPSGIPGVSGVPGKDGKNGANGTNGVSGLEMTFSSWVDVKAFAVGTAIFNCPSGKKATGVMCFTTSLNTSVVLRTSSIYAGGSGGTCSYYNGSNQTVSIMAQAICVTAN